MNIAVGVVRNLIGVIIMNRAERRRNKIKQDKKEPVYNISEQNLDNLKQNIRKDAINTALVLMLGLPIKAFHDNIADLWKKEVDGKSREERLFDYIFDRYKEFEDGKITLDDIIKDVEELTGNKIQFKDDHKGKLIV